MAHGVIRTDRLSGTTDGAKLVSVKYMGAGSTATAIDNGSVVKLDGLMSNEREIFKGVTPSAADAISAIAVIAAPEVWYDGLKHDIKDYVNEAGKVVRAYRLCSGDVFSVTADALTATAPAVGDIVELQAGTTLNVVDTLTSGSTKVGTIIDTDTTDGRTYFAILVA